MLCPKCQNEVSHLKDSAAGLLCWACWEKPMSQIDIFNSIAPHFPENFFPAETGFVGPGYSTVDWKGSTAIKMGVVMGRSRESRVLIMAEFYLN